MGTDKILYNVFSAFVFVYIFSTWGKACVESTENIDFEILA